MRGVDMARRRILPADRAKGVRQIMSDWVDGLPDGVTHEQLRRSSGDRGCSTRAPVSRSPATGRPRARPYSIVTGKNWDVLSPEPYTAGALDERYQPGELAEAVRRSAAAAT
jgi:hypothetical protein